MLNNEVIIEAAKNSKSGYSKPFQDYQNLLEAEFEKYIYPLISPFKLSVSKFKPKGDRIVYLDEGPASYGRTYSDEQLSKSKYLIGALGIVSLKKTKQKLDNFREYASKVYNIKNLPNNYTPDLLSFNSDDSDTTYDETGRPVPPKVGYNYSIGAYVKNIITTAHFSLFISAINRYSETYYTLYLLVSIPKEDSFVKQIEESYDIHGKDVGLYSELTSFFYELATGWLLTGRIPIGLDSDYNFSPIPKDKVGIYRTMEGPIITLNNLSEQAKALYKSNIAKGNFRANYNKIIGIDYNTSNIYYTDGNGDLKNQSFVGASRVSDKDRMYWINAPLDSIFGRSGDSLANIYDFNRVIEKYLYSYNPEEVKIGDKFRKFYNLVNPDFISTQYQGDGKEFDPNNFTLGDALSAFPYDMKELFEELEKIGRKKYGQISPINYIAFMGTLSLLKELPDIVDELRAKSLEQKQKFESVSVNDLPELPYINPEINLFPHQAEALAKLTYSPELACVDVSTGGGKTPIGVFDALIQLKLKNATRCLFIVPLSLIGQWISQIRFFTKGQVNVVSITTDSINAYGEDKLEIMCKNAPDNTLFITSMSFIATGVTKVTDDVFSYPRVDWLIDVIKPDYVWIDESHKIKSPKTNTFKAASLLGAHAKVRRIATGTLINNKPVDLVGQIGFLDPNAIGNERKFKERYTDDGVYKKNFVQLIRRDLRENLNYILYREKDWASCLPKFKYTYDFVEMNPAQKANYKKLVQKILDEIRKDPELLQAWENLINSGNEDIEIPTILLGKLARLEQYLTAPEISEFLRNAGEGATISPKLKKMDEYIEQSLKANYKVIVAVHYKISAAHLMKYSRFRQNAIYYDASHKDAIQQFVNNDNVKVLFAVQQSLKEGFNLQVANRVIVMDVDWTPGGLKQLEARVLRPSLEWKNGKLINKNLNKTVYINTILCNDSADITKFCFQAYKKIINANIMEDCPVEPIEPPSFSDDALSARYGDPLVGGTKVIDALSEYENWMVSQIEDQRNKGNTEFYKPVVAKPFNNSKIIKNTPWERGMSLPCEEGEIPLAEWLENNDVTGDSNLTEFRKELLGKVVNTQFGRGVIIGVNKNSVRVENDKGDKWSNNIEVTVLKPESSKENLKKVIEQDRKVATATPSTETKPRVDVNIPKTAPLTKGIDVTSKKEQRVTLAILNGIGQQYGYKLKVVRGEVNNTYNWIKLDTKESGPDIVLETVRNKSKDWWIDSLKQASAYIKRGARVEAPQLPEEVRQEIKQVQKKAATKVVKKIKVAEENKINTQGKDSQIELAVATYNDIPCLIAYPQDPDTEDLAQFNFEFLGRLWLFPVESKQLGLRCLTILNRDFNINPRNLNECKSFLENVQSGKYFTKFPSDARNFMKLRLKKAAQGNLKIYPLVINKQLYFVVDAKSHPTISLRKYRFELIDGFWCYIGLVPTSLSLMIKKLEKKFTITNIEELRQTALSTFKIRI